MAAWSTHSNLLILILVTASSHVLEARGTRRYESGLIIKPKPEGGRVNVWGGKTYDFTCHANKTITEKLKIHWLKEGKLLPVHGNIDGVIRYKGGRGNVTLLNTTHAHEGHYSCIGRGERHVYSRNFIFSIYGSYFTDLLPPNIYAVRLSRVQLNCTVHSEDIAQSSNKSIYPQWLKDGQRIISNDENCLIQSRDSNVRCRQVLSEVVEKDYIVSTNLILNPANKKDRGLYTCKAGAGIHEVQKWTNLIVLEQVKFLHRLPLAKTVEFGDSFTLNCGVANNQDKTTVVWTRRGNLLDNSTRVKLPGNGVLKIINFTISDVGLYKCEASNRAETRKQETEVKLKKPELPQMVSDYEEANHDVRLFLIVSLGGILSATAGALMSILICTYLDKRRGRDRAQLIADPIPGQQETPTRESPFNSPEEVRHPAGLIWNFSNPIFSHDNDVSSQEDDGDVTGSADVSYVKSYDDNDVLRRTGYDAGDCEPRADHMIMSQSQDELITNDEQESTC